MSRLVAATVALIVAAGVLAACPLAQAQPAPAVYAYPALYRLDHGQWQRSLLFEPGDQVRFVMPFLTVQPGWGSPEATFQVQRERVPFYAQPVIYRHSMERRHAPHGYAVFSVSFRVTGRRWIGHWIAEAEVTNGQGTIGPTFYFTVLPHLPQLFDVPQAIALCHAQPKLARTITVGGVWGEVNSFGQDQIARGWIAERWAGRGAIPHWWEHSALWLTFPRSADGGAPPPDGFLEVLARLDCRSHTLTAVGRPALQ